MPFAANQSRVTKPPFWVAMQRIFTRNTGIKHFFPFFSSCDIVSCALAWPVNRVSQVTSQRPHRTTAQGFQSPVPYTYIHTYIHTYIFYSTGLFSHNVNYCIILVIKKRKLFYSSSIKFKIIQNIFNIISYEIY